MEEKLESFNQVLEKTDWKGSVRRIISNALTEDHSFALWNKPQNENHSLIINLGNPIKLREVEIESMDPGFIVSDFAGEERFFLRADLSYETQGQSLEILQDLNQGKLEAAEQMLENGLSDLHTPFHSNATEARSEQLDYSILVQEAISEIEKGKMEKVVPARQQFIDTNDLSIVDLYFSLAEKYPNAFVYLISIKGVGSWIGATPELLLRVEDSRWFETVSLAGTQKYRDDIKLSEVAWTQKEIEEQALVSRYIINSFKKIRLREFEEHGPKTAIAGNVMHLKTTFKVDMEETNFPQLGSVMLDLLHPTSAVCGMPKDNALEFINSHEGFDRKLFSGYLGPVNYANSTAIFVNLRCMEYLGKKGILYAGAGVTEDSDPEKEIQETELKFNTILEAINSIH